jgi:hypothetical protein
MMDTSPVETFVTARAANLPNRTTLMTATSWRFGNGIQPFRSFRPRARSSAIAPLDAVRTGRWPRRGGLAPSRSAATPCGPPICNGCSGVGVPCGQDSQCCSKLCLNFPRGIAIHGSKVYVADGSNDRIQQFSLSGSFQLKWGGTGGGNGKFHNPFDVAVDQAGSVYVADRLNHRVQELLDGSYVTQFGGIGSGAGELDEPHALAVDGKGWVYVADSGHARIVAFKPA